MSVSNPSELRKFLESLGTRAKKGLSQNFLIDGNILSKIVDAAEVSPHEAILEIGPGPGALTEILLQKKAAVFAVEKDAIFAEALKRFKTESNSLKVFSEDFLEFDLDELPKAIKVVANLPYHLTTPILEKLIESKKCTRIVVMVQLEVAERICSPPGPKVFGSLSVFLQYFAKVQFGFKVFRKCFHPAPNVDSAIIILEPKKERPLSLEEEKGFFKMVRLAFNHRRKMLRGSLKEIYSPAALSIAFQKAKIDETRRPETLSVEEFIQLYKSL